MNKIKIYQLYYKADLQLSPDVATALKEVNKYNNTTRKRKSSLFCFSGKLLNTLIISFLFCIHQKTMLLILLPPKNVSKTPSYPYVFRIKIWNKDGKRSKTPYKYELLKKIHLTRFIHN